MKFLMVCLGNICRSPMAEGILKKRIEELSLPWHVDSAGIYNGHVGQPPHQYSIKTAARHGLDISHQRARQFDLSDLAEFDIIYAMDLSVYESIQQMITVPQLKEKVILFLNEVHPNGNESVPDPYFGTEFGFEPVFRLLEDTMDHIIDKYYPKDQ